MATSKPVKILVLDLDLYESPEVQALIAKGHEIQSVAEGDEMDRDPINFDLIIGRRAWYIDKPHLKYLDKLAIPAARKRQANRAAEETK